MVIPDLSTTSPIGTCLLSWPPEIVVARDDRAFRHRGMGGVHLMAAEKYFEPDTLSL
jgi:hypothetical protein